MRIESGALSEPPWLHMRGQPRPAPPVVDLNAAGRAELRELPALSDEAANALLKLRRRRPVRDLSDVRDVAALKPAALRSLRDVVVGAIRPDVVVLDAEVVGEHIYSDRPWALLVRFLPPTNGAVTLARFEVTWRGEPFAVERLVSPEESAAGELTLEIDDAPLPPGPMELGVTVYDDGGGADGRELGEWVLPSNPLTMFLSPHGRSIYNGSVRPDWRAPNWVTEVNVTFLNGDPADVRLNRRVEWSFWDGPVGSGTLVESGAFDWSHQIVVPARGNYGGWAWFNSPPGSGIHRRYEDREDMALQLVFTREDGTRLAAEITCRIMAGWGVNVIQVGSYTAAEQQTILAGLNDARSLYENFGLTFSSVQWWIIPNDRVGGYQTLDNRGEWVSLLDDWTVQGDSIDCFVVRGMWSNFIGWSPIAGPARKDGACEDDGLAVTFSLGCLAHEFGHYVGGHNHVTTAGNLMNATCGSRTITYDQYRTYLRHGYTRIVR